MAATAAPGAVPFDLIIRGGRVVDGTGQPAFVADLGLRSGRIAAIGKVSGPATAEFDASGLIVAPGFIDVHTHAEDIESLPLAENFVRMGVTTVILGNCGSSTLEVAGFFRRLEAIQFTPNVGTLVGHGSIRAQVMGGSFMRPPTPQEIAAMKEVVERAMKEGALGLSTGLIYLPGTFASTEELIEMATVAGRYHGIYATHMRSEGREIFQALTEVFRIARAARLPVEISHLKLSGKTNWGQADKVLAAIHQARTNGLQITQDQYLYTAASTGISQLIPDEYREGDRFEQTLVDPAKKAQLVAGMKQQLLQGGREDYAHAFIASYAHDPSLNGLSLPEAAKTRRGSGSLADQIELILDLQRHGGASAVFHGIAEEDIRRFLGDANTMFASDSGVRKFQEGVPHPRGYGNNARVLAHYVRELNLLSLEEAIRRMTSLPAATFGLADRGSIREGAWADLVLFDPRKVQENATFAQPHRYATGFSRVLVNGVTVVQNDEHTRARPGRALRRVALP